jgi:hypothetical protein
VRDMGPITNDVYGTEHGRYARAGENDPVSIWITEVGFAPDEDGINDSERQLALKAKTTARYYAFYLNKGVEKLQLFSATAGDGWLGVVQDNFVEYARQNNSYPPDDGPYTSPALKVTSNMVAKMKEGLDPNLTSEATRSLTVDSITDEHDHRQFDGDGTAAHPPLYDREVFAFLPYQANRSRFVIAYYVMTRDVTKDQEPEEFALRIGGLVGEGAEVSAYDPIKDEAVPVTVSGRGEGALDLTLTAADYPYLLMVEER